MESLLAGQSSKEREDTRIVCPLAVADLDLQIGGGGGGKPDPKLTGGHGLKKRIFGPSGLSLV